MYRFPIKHFSRISFVDSKNRVYLCFASGYTLSFCENTKKFNVIKSKRVISALPERISPIRCRLNRLPANCSFNFEALLGVKFPCRSVGIDAQIICSISLSVISPRVNVRFSSRNFFIRSIFSQSYRRSLRLHLS